MAKLISVIESETTHGNGTEQNPSRFVTQYFDLDGALLAEVDSWRREELRRLCYELDQPDRLEELTKDEIKLRIQRLVML